MPKLICQISLCNTHKIKEVEIDSCKIKESIDANRGYTTRDVAEILNVSKSSVENHLEALGYVSRLWMPHQLEEIHLFMRDSLLKTF